MLSQIDLKLKDTHMEKTLALQPSSLSDADKDAKKHATIAYALMLLGFFTGFCFILGGIWGMYKRSEAKNTKFADHYDNIIKTFCVSIVLTVIGVATAVFIIGYFILLFAVFYTLWKVIKGLIRVTSDKGYK